MIASFTPILSKRREPFASKSHTKIKKTSPYIDEYILILLKTCIKSKILVYFWKRDGRNDGGKCLQN